MQRNVVNLVLALVVAGLACGGCMQRTVAIPRTELANVPADGQVVVIDQSAQQHPIRARRVTVRGQGDILDDLIRDGYVFTPADTLRFPAKAEDLTAFSTSWLAEPSWTEAEIAFDIMEPEVLPWAIGGGFVGGLAAGAVAYQLATCTPGLDSSCEDFETVRALVAVLCAGLGAATGTGVGILGYLYVAEPGYAIAW